MTDSKKIEKESLAIVIPVYNETEIIDTVIQDWVDNLRPLAIDFSIHLYNDGSKDNTLSVCKEIEKKVPELTVHDKANSGHGPTILKGYCDNLSHTWLFQIDSDNELPAAHFKLLWEQRNDADFLIGIRENRENPLPRRLISLISRLCVRLFYGTGVYDVNSPYRLMRVEKLRATYEGIPKDTFAPNVIISGMVNYLGLRIVQIDVPHRQRETGEVSIKKFKLLKVAIKSFFQTILFSFNKPGKKSDSGCANEGCCK
ncbi:glycosyltransferase family 2 protein [bacterium]|jgi:dolichol-phosphate mannosyltransferase|nr:glycosyltransferase family 2 protein [bacterium]